MSSKGIMAWMGTVLVAVIGTVALSTTATAKQALTSPPAVIEQDEATPLAQSDSDPSFGSFLGACNTNSDCSDGNSCQSFKKRGNHCTHACQAGSDCAGTRCTNQFRCGLLDPIKTK